MVSAKSGTDYIKYRWIEDVEDLEKYQPGGYHPVCIGDVLEGRYRVIHKLGYGGYSTVWLARDQQLEVYVAVKISTADSPARESEILYDLAKFDHPGRSMIPLIQDQLELRGPNGSHKCYVTSPARSNLDDAQDSDCFITETARVIAAQLIMSVAYLHARGYVHGDIHPGNVLLRLPSNFDSLSIEQFYEKFGKPRMNKIIRADGQPLTSNVPEFGIVPVWIGKRAKLIPSCEGHLLLSDFGETFLVSQQRPGTECHSPLIFRSPETYFESEKPISCSSDIWSLACTIWPILGLQSLFSDFLATGDDIISQHIDTIGLSSFPSNWFTSWQNRHEYFESDRPKESRSVRPSLERSFENKVQAWRRRARMGEFDQEESAALLAMLRKMLIFSPAKRATAESLLASKWMTNWGLPELKKAGIIR